MGRDGVSKEAGGEWVASGSPAPPLERGMMLWGDLRWWWELRTDGSHVLCKVKQQRDGV